MSIFQATAPAVIPEKREQYSLYAGKNFTELGNIFIASESAMDGDKPQDGFIRLNGIMFDQVDVKEGYYTVQKRPYLAVKLNPEVVKAWEELTKSGLGSVSISYNVDKEWFVSVSCTGMSNYTVGKLTTQDVRALVEVAGLKFSESLESVFGEA